MRSIKFRRIFNQFDRELEVSKILKIAIAVIVKAIFCPLPCNILATRKLFYTNAPFSDEVVTPLSLHIIPPTWYPIPHLKIKCAVLTQVTVSVVSSVSFRSPTITGKLQPRQVVRGGWKAVRGSCLNEVVR